MIYVDYATSTYAIIEYVFKLGYCRVERFFLYLLVKMTSIKKPKVLRLRRLRI